MRKVCGVPGNQDDLLWGRGGQLQKAMEDRVDDEAGRDRVRQLM